MDNALLFISEALNENVDQYDEMKRNTDLSEQEIQQNFDEERIQLKHKSQNHNY